MLLLGPINSNKHISATKNIHGIVRYDRYDIQDEEQQKNFINQEQNQTSYFSWNRNRFKEEIKKSQKI